jgi:AcrR family transcriptional regulator
MGNEPTRERILVEASKLLQLEGLEGFSMRKLAAIVDLSATALYRHYADKDQLLVAACAEGFERFARSLWQALQEPTDWERLHATPRHYLRFALSEPHFYRVMFMTKPLLASWETIPEAHQRRIRGTFEFLVDRVAAAGRVHPFIWSDPRQVASSIWAHCHGAVALRLDGHVDELDDASFEAFYGVSVDAHLRGLKA